MQKFILLLLLFQFVGSNAYNQFTAVHIPVEKLSLMKIDGDTSDWSWVPKKYHITTGLMNEILSNARKDEKNWKGKIMVGWNEAKNWIYILVVVLDDIRNVDRKSPENIYWLDDCLELSVNPSNSSGRYDDKNSNTRNRTIKLHYSFPVAEPAKELELDYGPQWFLKKNTYLDWAGKVYGSNKKQSSIVVYELGISLWDLWRDEGLAFSKRHILTAGQLIHLSIVVNDVDAHPDPNDINKDKRSAQWATLSGSAWWGDANQLSTFRLDYPIFKDLSWDNIVQILKPN